MSETAKRISGRTYVCEPNSLGFRQFRLTFQAAVVFEFSFREKDVVEVGTDGAPRMTETCGYVRSYEGRWSEDDTFAMAYEIVGTAESGRLDITFHENGVTVLFCEDATGAEEVMSCRWDREASEAE